MKQAATNFSLLFNFYLWSALKQKIYSTEAISQWRTSAKKRSFIETQQKFSETL